MSTLHLSAGPRGCLPHPPGLIFVVRESSHAATGQHHLNQTFRYGISKSRRFLKIEWESGQRNEAPPTGWGRLCRLRNPVQMPTGAERDRSSVGGALELSGTGARSGWSADFSCEHPVGGPCVTEPTKVRHADQRSAGEQVGVHSGGPDLYCPACSLCKHRWPARTKSGGLVERAGCASRGGNAHGRMLLRSIGVWRVGGARLVFPYPPDPAEPTLPLIEQVCES